MPSIKEQPNLGDLLKYEAPNLYSREVGAIAAGQTLRLGTVLARDASNQLKAVDPNAADGSQLAVGVLMQDVDASVLPVEDALWIARHAIVASHALVWGHTMDSSQLRAAIDGLANHGILVRQSA